MLVKAATREIPSATQLMKTLMPSFLFRSFSIRIWAISSALFMVAPLEMGRKNICASIPFDYIAYLFLLQLAVNLKIIMAI